jgi:hypothetical protein
MVHLSGSIYFCKPFFNVAAVLPLGAAAILHIVGAKQTEQ